MNQIKVKPILSSFRDPGAQLYTIDGDIWGAKLKQVKSFIERVECIN